MPPISTSTQRAFSTLLLYSTCAFCLLLPALYNGYPLVNPDSGAYIANGWLLDVPIDRPITYSIFVRVASLSGVSLWGVALAQTLLLVWLLRRVSRRLLADQYNDRLFVALVILLSAFTSAGWFCSLITADIFTALLILAIADFYLSTPSRSQKVAYFALLWFFVEQHNSHLLIILLFCIIALAYGYFRRQKQLRSKTLFLSAVTVFSFISISFFNLWEGNSFRPSASTHIFLMARMAENGILDKYLDEYCPTEHYTLCDYRNNTGDRQWEFMWGDHGHLHDAGGWDKVEEEYNHIIFRTLTNPRYLALQVYESLEATIRQIPQLQVSVMAQGNGSSPYNAINDYLPGEIKEYRSSLQQTNVLQTQMGYFNGLIFLFAIITIVSTLFTYNRSDAPQLKDWTLFLTFVVVLILLNAFVTATFSTVIDRLQSRVFWLLPFTCLLYLNKRVKKYVRGVDATKKYPTY